ncbi:MAG: multi-sensor hybrid histidine kinase [Verrucomicrobiales bacterium]|nr:multi-sensor hybrid histidine kinase [Verrucomicrobiales bacterium]
MHTSELTFHGYIMAEPPVVQGTPAGDFFNSLIRGLVHKQNNFLAVIQGFSSLILMNDGLDTTTKENLDHMKEAAQGAAVLAERILAAGGCVRITPQSVQLKDYLQLMDATLRAPFLKFNVPFQINTAPHLPAVLVDSGRFKEILCDLLLNAAEAVAASGEPGAAALDILPPGQIPESRPNCVDILVRNTGAPIPPAKLKEVFKPFTSTRDSRHFGIGLVVASVMAAQMGATLGAKSTPEVTTFWLSVPVAP